MQLGGEEVFFLPYLYNREKWLAYAPLRSFLALMPREAALTTMKTDGAGTVERGELLDRLKSRPLIDIGALHAAFRNATPELSLALTDDCNLRCVYCHASAGEPTKRACMSKPILKKVMNIYFQAVKPKKARLSFAGGGEPTYDFDLMRYAVTTACELATATGIEFSLRMATNGCYDDNVRKYIAQYYTEVSVSLDGPPHIHDRHRPRADSLGSFDQVFETARYLTDTELSVAFRATLSSYSLNYIDEIVRFFADNFPGRSVGLEPLNAFGRGVACATAGVPSKKAYAEAMLTAYTIAEALPIRLVNAGVGKFDSLRTVFCGAVGIPSWTVTTDGTIACCTRDNAPEIFTLGRIEDRSGEITVDMNKLRELRRLNVFNFPECSDCFCKYHCAGDCPDLRLANANNCSANKRLGQYVLSQKIRTAQRKDSQT